MAWARGKLLASLITASACSLFAPTDADIAGGATQGSGGIAGNASSASGGAAQTQGGAPEAGAPGDSGAGGGRSSGGATGRGGATSGGSATGGVNATGGATTCVADVTSTRPKASTLLDDFSNGTAGPGFFVNGSPTTCATESAGSVVVALPNPVPASEYCYYQTSTTYDLTCDSIVLKVSQVARSAVGLQTFIYVFPDDTHKLFLVVENGTYILASEGGDDSTGGPYEPTNPWWRLREVSDGSARLVTFETSPDGSAWTERARLVRPFPLNNVRIAFGAGAYQATPNPGSGAFACYNRPASCR